MEAIDHTIINYRPIAIFDEKKEEVSDTKTEVRNRNRANLLTSSSLLESMKNALKLDEMNADRNLI